MRKTELLLPIACLVAVLFVAIVARAALFPFVLSLALTYMLNPLIVFFESRGMKRVYVVSAFYLISGIVATYLTYKVFILLTQEIEMLKANWPAYHDKIEALLVSAQDTISTKMPFMKSYLVGWQEKLAPMAASYAEKIPTFALAVLPILSVLVLVPFISFFFLAEGGEMIDGFLDLLPSRHVEMAMHIISEIDQSLGNYLRGILTEALILFALALVGLSLMDLEYAAGIAIAMGVSCLIPYIGPLVGGVLGAIAAFVQFGTLNGVINVILFFVGLRFFDDWVLQPYIMKKAVEVHPTIIVLSLLVGAELFGIWGVVFAMPVTCILKVLLQIAWELHKTEFAWKPPQEPTRISIPYT